ncbi:MAG: OmpH family outer membrane protein [Alistipes sp.]
MKKILFTALAVAIALSSCTNKQAAETVATETQAVVSSDMAYVEVETVLSKCDLYLKEGVALQKKTETAQKGWAQKERNLQYEAAQLQEKYQKGLITTNDAQIKQKSIEQKAQSYQASAQKDAQTLDEENYVFTNRAQELLRRAVKEINAEKKYKLVVNANALIDADTTLNITSAVLATVNKLYAADQKESPKKVEEK